MTVAFDVSDLSTARADGTTRYTFELARRLPALSYNDWYYHASASSPLLTRAIGNQTTVTPIVTPWPKYWTQLRLPWALYQHPADVLFMPIQQIPYIRPRRLATIAVIHDLAFHYYPEQTTRKDWLLLHLFTAYVAREADHIIAVSQATADDIAARYGRTKEVTVIHHGLDHDQFTPLRESHERKVVAEVNGVPREARISEQSGARLSTTHGSSAAWPELSRTYPTLRRPYILFVGQIQPRKNVERLVGAFEQLKQNNSDLQLVIAGGHGWKQAPIYARVERSTHRQDILVTGPVNDAHLPSLYQHAAAFVLPSLYEGFGMPILEAMACGTPVVTSNVSSLPEVAGDAAMLIDPLSVDSITDGLTQALRDPVPWRDRGLARAAEFSWDATARATLQVIQKYQERKSPSSGKRRVSDRSS